MDLVKQFIKEGINKMEVHEYLQHALERAGYVEAQLLKTPIGTRILIYAERPSLVIGRRGSRIREIARILEKRFGLENPQIDVVQIPNPELNAKIMAYWIARAIARGVRFRRAAFIALRRIMSAGALGAEIIISGKLTSERARTEKFRDGIVFKSGRPRELLVDEASVQVLLKLGVYGVKVKIAKPVERIPGRVEILK
ncbi:MAG: 30S ribosomal protein S3 [Thermoproteales archaeon]|nr:30S ribosomal protein S3 [Thermoproteales archaeon]RLE66338.1 MAG: 30S ribosomal protein S3 [Thermoprotei archaeon]